ncbi:hypothetical protein [Ensifer canadensis]
MISPTGARGRSPGKTSTRECFCPARPGLGRQCSPGRAFAEATEGISGAEIQKIVRNARRTARRRREPIDKSDVVLLCLSWPISLRTS